MSGFAPDWLALREPADTAARDPSLLAWLRRSGWAAEDDQGGAASRTADPETVGGRSRGGALPSEPAIPILDLGAGTGANLRYTAPRLGGRQDWRLVDHDPALLAAVLPATKDWAAARGAQVVQPNEGGFTVRGGGIDCSVRGERRDLVADIARLDVPAGGLVTASALLDLVSADWLEALAVRCAAANAAVLFALTYDGRIALSPPEPGDERVRELVNAHQRSDKGFGPALGPAAADAAREAFAAGGYSICTVTTDWRLGPESTRLQRALLDGWRDAALELAPGDADFLAEWHTRRAGEIDARRCEIVVGHVDLAGVPRNAG